MTDYFNAARCSASRRGPSAAGDADRQRALVAVVIDGGDRVHAAEDAGPPVLATQVQLHVRIGRNRVHETEGALAVHVDVVVRDDLQAHRTPGDVVDSEAERVGGDGQ